MNIRFACLLIFLGFPAYSANVGPVKFKAEVRAIHKDRIEILWNKNEFTLPRSAVAGKKFPVPSVQEIAVSPAHLNLMRLSLNAKAAMGQSNSKTK